MPKPLPPPVYQFQQDGNEGVTSLAFGSIFGETFLLSGSENGHCCLYNVETMKMVKKIQFSTQNSHKKGKNKCTVLSCGFCPRFCAIWAYFKTCGLSIWYLDTMLDIRHEVIVENCNFYGFCGAAVFQLNFDQKSRDFAILPIDDGFKIIAILENGFQSIMSILNHGHVKHGKPMCMKCWPNIDKAHILIGYESGDLYYFCLKFENGAFSEISRSFFKANQEAITGVDWFTRKIGASETAVTLHGFAVSVNDNFSAFSINDDGQFIDLFKENINFWSRNENPSELQYSGCSSVAARRDGKIFAVGFWNGKTHVYSVKTGRFLAALCVHSKGMTQLTFCDPEICPRVKQYLACASNDGTISLWLLYD